MTRRLAVLAILVCAGPAFGAGEGEPEHVLADKGLVRSGAAFLLRGEEDVRKAAEDAAAKLREYRRAAAWEKDSVRSEADRKALAADLTKVRAALKQQMDQTLPQIQGQVRMIQQQQAMLNQQRQAMGGGRTRFGSMAANQLAGQSNQLGYQINMLQAQGRQMTADYNDLGYRIEQLNPRPGSDTAKAQAAARPKVSSVQSKSEYTEAVAALRKVVDETKTKYDALTDDDAVKTALAALDQHSGKIKHTLGPSQKFLDTVKALDQAETRIANDDLDPPAAKSAASTKRKTRTVKRKRSAPTQAAPADVP